MPLRDHFHSPLDDFHSWDELHGIWPAMIVQSLVKLLPRPFFAAASIHLSSPIEVDVGTFQQTFQEEVPLASDNGGVATAIYSPPKPTAILQAHIPDQDTYEVRIYDSRRHRRLVAAIELISPSNKDRPESRNVFVTKVASLLKNYVCVSIVDLVSSRESNLYAEMLNLIDGNDPSIGEHPTSMYATTLRLRLEGTEQRLDTWYYPMSIGDSLPSLPVWLTTTFPIKLDLENTYEETCRTLRIS